MDSIFKISKFFMIINGLWVLPLHHNLIVQILYKAYSQILHFIYALFSISLIIGLIDLIVQKASSDRVFGSLTLTLILSMISCKIFFYLRNGVPHLFAEVIDEEAVCLNSLDPDIKKSYLNQVKYNKWAMTVHTMCTFITVGLFIGMNVYKKINRLFKTDEVFMLELWIPIDKTENDMLIIVFNIFIIIVAFFNNVAVSAVPQTLMVFINAQLRILQIEIRKVFDPNREELDVTHDVNRLIMKHQHIIEFASQLNKAIENLILLEYISDSLNVAAALLHTITIPFSGEMMYSIFHSLILLARIFIVAWTATESMNVGIAIYESNWTGQSNQVKMLLQIMMMRAQKPLAICIGPFRELNNEACLITMKGAYSYASLMMQKYLKA
ncbi:hypothetical protein HUJ04_006901 [Dendroctonus ponderosae]|nr:hypothetical protein HUJ04_006901 [Dendroctonus ponderosae]